MAGGVKAYSAPIEMFIGVGVLLRFKVRDVTGDLVDATGWSLSWMLKRRLADPDADAIIVKTTSVGAITIDGSSVSVAISDADTDPLVARSNYRHELKRIDAGLEAVLAYGELSLIRGVHRS